MRPAAEYLPAYVAALQRGYSPSAHRPEKRLEELDAIAADGDAFLALCEDLDGARRSGSAAGRIASTPHTGIPTLDMGRRFRRQHRAALANRNAGAAGMVPTVTSATASCRGNAGADTLRTRYG